MAGQSDADDFIKLTAVCDRVDPSAPLHLDRPAQLHNPSHRASLRLQLPRPPAKKRRPDRDQGRHPQQEPQAKLPRPPFDASLHGLASWWERITVAALWLAGIYRATAGTQPNCAAIALL